MCWNFFAGNLDFYKDSLIHKWLSKTVLSRGSWLREAGVDSWATAGSTVGPKYVCPLPNATVGETLPRSLDIWYWVPQLPREHFCLWMDAKLLLLGVGGDTNKGYLIHPRCSLYINSSIPNTQFCILYST